MSFTVLEYQNKPLVTIITPTTPDRVEFNERITAIAQAQDYPNIEHLICYDDFTVGAKRNILCKQAKGSIIVCMDSDDIYSPDWVSKSVEHLLKTGANVTGLKDGYFYNPYETKAWLYQYSPKNTKPYVLGATMCFLKTAWDKIKFPDMRAGEDTEFCKRVGNIQHHEYISGFVAFIHGFNTSSHKSLGNMKAISPNITENIINSHYRIEGD